MSLRVTQAVMEMKDWAKIRISFVCSFEWIQKFCVILQTYNNERNNIMALEIRPIPVLTGIDAERFIEEAEAAERNPHTVELALSQEDFERMMAKAQLN